MEMNTTLRIFTADQGENKPYISGNICLSIPSGERIELMEHILEWIRSHGKLVLLCTCVILACAWLWANHKQLFYKE
ncbi:hypothetical protein [Paenibacillus pabuli]|uniref:hypothetical protein n=1 Tax=Paenibacillus pabuli TaxID=1472 RepID=UPI001C3F1750|nr:hypothetical protein [Paenibacillus pabuli]